MTTAEAMTGAKQSDPYEVWDRPRLVDMDYRGAPLRMWADSRVIEHSRAHASAKEPWTVEWIESMSPDEVLYDVGASTGPYSLIAGTRKLRVYAFEPSVRNYSRLVDHVALNKLVRQIVPLPIALSSKTGLGILNYAAHFAGSSGHTFWPLDDSLAQPPRHKPVLQQFVMGFRMDDLQIYDPNIQMPNHIKIDVDGAEQIVLKGAAATFASPSFKSLMMEMDDDKEELLALAESLGLVLVKEFDASDATEWKMSNGADRHSGAYGLFRRRAS